MKCNQNCFYQSEIIVIISLDKFYVHLAPPYIQQVYKQIIIILNMEGILKALYQKQRFTNIHKKSRLVQSPFNKKQTILGNRSNIVSNSVQIKTNTSVQVDKTKKSPSSISRKKYLLENGLKRLKRIENQQKLKRQKQKVKLPSINKQSKPNCKQLLKKFKMAAHAALFISVLSKMRKKTVIARRQRNQYILTKFGQIVYRMITNYYVPLLQEQIYNYFNILELKVLNPSLNLDKEILSNIYYVTQKLTYSTIRKDFLELLTAVLSAETQLFSGFFSEFQIKRLQLNHLGIITDMTKEQKRMIIGLFVGVKLLCSHIFYRPWLLKIWNFNTVKIFQKCEAVISSYGSIYYYIMMEEFKKVPIIKNKLSQQQILYQLKIQTMKKTSVYPDSYSQPQIWSKSSQFDLLQNQNHSYYKKMSEEYPQSIHKIKRNIFRWIDRLLYVLQRKSDKKRPINSNISSQIMNLSGFSNIQYDKF